MPTTTSDLIPLFYGAAVRLWIARRLEKDLPDTEVTLTGKQIEEWSTRLLDAMEQEWNKIKSEL